MNYGELLRLVEELAVPLAKAPATHRIPLGRGITGGRLPPVDAPAAAPRIEDGSPEARAAMGRIMEPYMKSIDASKSAAYAAGMRHQLTKLGFLPVVSGTLGVAESLAASQGEPIHIRAGKAGMTGLGAVGGNLAGSAIGGTIGGLTLGPLGALGGMLVGGMTGSTLGAMAGHRGTGLAIEGLKEQALAVKKDMDEEKAGARKHKKRVKVVTIRPVKRAQEELLNSETTKYIMRALEEATGAINDKRRADKLIKDDEPKPAQEPPIKAAQHTLQPGSEGGAASYAAPAAVATGLAGAGVYGLGRTAERVDRAFDKWRAGSAASHPVMEAALQGETDPAKAPATLARNISEHDLGRVLERYEVGGSRVLNQKLLGLPLPRWGMNAYWNMPLRKLTEIAHDAPRTAGLGSRILEGLTAPVRAATVPPTDAERELLRSQIDHYKMFETRDRHALLDHWLHRMQRETDRPSFESIRSMLTHNDVAQVITPSARSVMSDPTTNTSNVLQRLRERAPDASNLYNKLKLGLSDTALTMVGAPSAGYRPASDIYAEGLRPITRALRRLKPAGAAAMVAAPAALIGTRLLRGHQEPPKTAQAVDRKETLKDVGAGTASALSLGGLADTLRRLRFQDLRPNAPVRIGVAGWHAHSPDDMFSDAPAQLNSFGAQTRGTLHGLRQHSPDVSLINTKHQPALPAGGLGSYVTPLPFKDIKHKLDKLDAVVQFGDQPGLDTPAARRLMRDRGTVRAWHVTDFGGGGTFKQRASMIPHAQAVAEGLPTNMNVAPMAVTNPNLYDLFVTPGADVLSDQAANSYRTQFGTERALDLHKRLINLENIPTMDVFRKSRFAADPAGHARAVYTVGGGSGAVLPYTPEMSRSGAPHESPGNLAKFMEQRTVLDDITDAMRAKHGDKFTLDYFPSHNPEITPVINEMKARQAAGDRRFANIAFRDPVAQAGIADAYSKANYIFGLPGSTMAEVASMTGKAPKVIGITPDPAHPRGSGVHWPGNNEFMSRVFPGYRHVNVADPDRAAALTRAVMEGHEAQPEWRGLKADYGKTVKAIEGMVKARRWGNLGRVGLFGAGATLPAAYLARRLMARHKGGEKQDPPSWLRGLTGRGDAEL